MSTPRFLPLALAAVTALAGCSVTTPPRITATTTAASAGALRIVVPDQAGAAHLRFSQSLSAALTERGFTLSETSPRALTISLAERPASLGVTQANSGPVAPAAWLSLPRRHGPFDACHAQRLEAIVLIKADDRAEPDYAGRGGFDYCALDMAQIDALASQFAAAIAAGR